MELSEESEVRGRELKEVVESCEGLGISLSEKWHIEFKLRPFYEAEEAFRKTILNMKLAMDARFWSEEEFRLKEKRAEEERWCRSNWLGDHEEKLVRAKKFIEERIRKLRWAEERRVRHSLPV